MATHNFRGIIYCCLLLGIILVGDVSARRGGGGGRSGGSRGRSRSSFGVGGGRSSSSYRGSMLTGRIVSGSSSYTGSTWRVAAMAGLILGGRSYALRYPHRRDLPPICTNNYEKTPEGKVFGYFICPLENQTDDFIYCCGGEKREYCCNMTMAMDYVSRYQKSGSLSVGAIVGITLSICVGIGIIIYYCQKGKHAGSVLGRFSSKADTAKDRDNDSSAACAPLNQPSHQANGFTPTVAPPSYDAATSKIMHGDGDPLPYRPPQPQPPPGYEEEKSGFPPAEIGSAQPPYWAPHLAGELPYPLQPATPYPPAGDSPYPPQGTDPSLPGERTPYPLAGSAPYPVPDSTPYPTPDNTPYPTTGNAPYPTPGSAPYPTPDNAPYPTSGSAPYLVPDNAPYSMSPSAPYPSSADAAPYHLTGSAPYFSEGSAPHLVASEAPYGGYPAPGTGGSTSSVPAPK